MTHEQSNVSGGDIHQQKTLAERQADAERYADEAARGKHGFPEMLRALLDRENLVNDEVRAGLAGDGTMRLAPPIPVRHYLSESHETLEQSVNESADPRIAGEIGQAWTDIGQEMIGFQADFARAVDASRDHWSGQAGDAARRFLVGVGEYIGQAGSSAQLAGVQAQEHSRALQSAKHSMPPPVVWDMRAALEDIGRTTDPVEYERKFTQFWTDYHAQRAAHEEAARVAGVFDRSISGASVLPAFPPPPQLDGGGDEPSDPRPGPGGDRPGFRPPADLGNVSPTDGRGGIGELDGHGGRDVSVPGRPDGIRTPELTGPESFIPSPVEVNVATGNPGVQGGGGGVTPVGGLPIGGRSGTATPDSGGNRGGGVSRGTGGHAGAGGRGAAGPHGGAPRGFGSRAGAAAASAAAEGRGAGGGRGSGAGGMPMGGGRGQGDEDIEHTRPEYLVEADPESVFGTDEATAPPVIGG